MVLRSAQVFRKSVASRAERGGPSAAWEAPFLAGRSARICSGRRISTRWPVLLRSSKRKAPSSSRRRTAWRTGPLDRPRSRATDKTAKCRRSLPTTREWRSKRSEEHTSELQSLAYLVCRLLLEKKKQKQLHSTEVVYYMQSVERRRD